MSSSQEITAVLPSGVKATFSAGIVPSNVELLNHNSSGFRIDNVRTSLKAYCYPPPCTAKAIFKTRQQMKAAARAVDGRDGVQARYRVRMVDGKPSFTVDLSNLHGEYVDEVVMNLPFPFAPVKIEMPECKSPQAYAVRDLELAIDKAMPRPLYALSVAGSTANRQILKAYATFVNSIGPNLSSVVRSIHERPTNELGGTKVFATEHVSLSYTLDNEVYNRRSRALKGIATDFNSVQKVRISIQENSKSADGSDLHAAKITLSGDGRDNVTRAKEVLEERIRQHWKTGIAYSLQPSKQTHRIRLTKTKAYEQATQGGLDRITDLLKHVNLDEQSGPPAVIVCGSGKDVQTAKKALYKQELGPKAEESMCAVCFDEDEKYLDTPDCEHTICTECLTGYCTTALDLPLRCFGNDCDALLPMRFLEKNLPEEDFNTVLEKAVEEYCQKNPSTITSCVGPDCKCYLSTADLPVCQTCPGCLTVNCTSCKIEFHFGETCEQYKLRQKGEEALEDYLVKDGGKRCPKCQTPVSKDGGCNHIDCKSCKIHFCWLCLATYDRMGECYAHLEEAHGGNGLDAEEFEQFENLADEVALDLDGGLADVFDPANIARLAAGHPDEGFEWVADIIEPAADAPAPPPEVFRQWREWAENGADPELNW